MNLMNHKDIHDQSNPACMGVDDLAPSTMTGLLGGGSLTVRQQRFEEKAPAWNPIAVVEHPSSLGPSFQLLFLVK